MGLSIDQKLHTFRTTDGTGMYVGRAIKLTRPLLVVKALDVRTWYEGDYTLMSPYRSTEWEPGVEKTEPRMVTTVLNMDCYPGIHTGLHACQNYDRFLEHFGYSDLSPHMIAENRRMREKYEKGMTGAAWLKSNRYNVIAAESYPFPAVIPAGANVWFGRYGDVVADRMTVYRSMRHYRSVYGSVPKGISPLTAVEAAETDARYSRVIA